MKFPLISLYRALLALTGWIFMILGVLAVLFGLGFGIAQDSEIGVYAHRILGGIGVYAGFVMIASAIPFLFLAEVIKLFLYIEDNTDRFASSLEEIRDAIKIRSSSCKSIEQAGAELKRAFSDQSNYRPQ